jgi:hypothetical protein
MYIAFVALFLRAVGATCSGGLQHIALLKECKAFIGDRIYKHVLLRSEEL